MRALFLFTFCLSCAGEEEKEAKPLTITDMETCGGAAPIIEEISCENTGMQFYPDEGADLPTMTIRLKVSDEDADFTAYTMLVRYDEELDNALAESAQSLTVTGTTSNTDCSVSEANIAMTIYIQSGGSPNTSTTYEWYTTVFDAAGERSDPILIECTTPDSSGSGAPQETGG